MLENRVVGLYTAYKIGLMEQIETLELPKSFPISYSLGFSKKMVMTNFLIPYSLFLIPMRHYISLFVNPSFRRQGIGKKLMNKAIAFSKRNKYTPIVYGKTNHQLSFYQSCGIATTQITRQAFPKQYWEHYRFVKKYIQTIIVQLWFFLACLLPSRSHALRGNASWTLCVLCLVLTRQGTQSVLDAFPRKIAGE